MIANEIGKKNVKENDENIYWKSESISFAIELEKFISTLSLGGIALVTALAKDHDEKNMAMIGLSFLLVTAFLSLRSMIILWETTTIQYDQIPISKTLSVKSFWIKISFLLIGFLALLSGFAF